MLYSIKIDRAKYKSEIDFWDWVMNISEPDRAFLLSKITGNGESAIQPPMMALLNSLNQHLEILDVGSGPVTDLIWAHKVKGANITCVDPLNAVYVEMLKKLGYDHPLEDWLVAARIEDLYTKNILNRTYDIVYTKNALDHVDNVVLAISSLHKLTSDGGYLYIAFHTKEGTNQNWEGLHTHDLWIEDFKVKYKNKDMKYGDSVTVIEPSKYLKAIAVSNNPEIGKLSTIIYRKG